MNLRTLKLSLLLLLFSLPTFLMAQTQNVTISGYIKDADSGETFIGASVYVKELQTGATSNEYGFYSITIPPGVYNLEYSYVGFESVKKEVTLKDNITMTIEMGVEPSSWSKLW